MNLRDGLIILTVLGLAVGVFLFNRPMSTPDTPSENTVVETKKDTRAQEGYLAPKFDLMTLDGKRVSLEQYKGKPTFITFWATWCSACKSELPEIQKVYETYKEQVNFLMVNVTDKDDKGKVKAFVTENKYSFPVLLDSDGKASMSYGVRGLPTTFILSSEGMVQMKKIGTMESEELNKSLQSAIKGK